MLDKKCLKKNKLNKYICMEDCLLRMKKHVVQNEVAIRNYKNHFYLNLK